MRWTIGANTRPQRRKAGLLILTTSLLISPPALAASWHLVQGGDRPTLIFGEDGSPEDVGFSARCQKGRVEVTYAAPDRASIAGGEAKSCGALRPCREKLPVTFLVDGKATQLEARAEPDEMSGGYAVNVTLEAKAPFWTSVKAGRSLSLRIDDKVGERIPLKGAKGPVAAFLAACGK